MTEEADLRRRQYERPPVLEAIARLEWSAPIEWSFTTPGLLFERLRETYPEEPREQGIVQAGMMPEHGKGSGGPEFKVQAGSRRILFGADNGSRLVGVSPQDLTAHALQPYEGWEALRGRLKMAAEMLRPLLGEALLVRRVGLRYINAIELPTRAVDFEDYLTITLSYPEGFPEKITGFLDRVELMYDDSTRMAFTWASTEASGEGLAFVLDLDLIRTLDEPEPLEQAFGRFEDLKVKEGRAFEALLRDRLREHFGEIK